MKPLYPHPPQNMGPSTGSLPDNGSNTPAESRGSLATSDTTNLEEKTCAFCKDPFACAVESSSSGPNKRDKLINRSQVKEIVQVSDMTLWRWIKSGRIPEPIYIGKRRYWRLGCFLAALGLDG